MQGADAAKRAWRNMRKAALAKKLCSITDVCEANRVLEEAWLDPANDHDPDRVSDILSSYPISLSQRSRLLFEVCRHNGDMAIVRFLLEKGASLRSTMGGSYTPEDVCAFAGDEFSNFLRYLNRYEAAGLPQELAVAAFDRPEIKDAVEADNISDMEIIQKCTAFDYEPGIGFIPNNNNDLLRFVPEGAEWVWPLLCNYRSHGPEERYEPFFPPDSMHLLLKELAFFEDRLTRFRLSREQKGELLFQVFRHEGTMLVARRLVDAGACLLPSLLTRSEPEDQYYVLKGELREYMAFLRAYESVNLPQDLANRAFDHPVTREAVKSALISKEDLAKMLNLPKTESKLIERF